MTMPALAAEAPPFELKNQDGEVVRLRDLKGGRVVLYFYPKDDTSGCTREACSFRDNHDAIRATGATVLGISGDTEASHRKFAAKHNLPFQLLVDDDHAVARAYGAWGMKSMYGRQYEGVLRSTFIIDPAGRIAAVWPKVKPAGHGDEVLAWLREHAR
ncbi:MAG TPA: thioredoxin-dependent thiol peroxidase [Tepidiformaceae bacterium]